MVRFQDRRDAGARLASALRDEVDPDVLVLGLARGGVPVAYEVARKLHAPLDVLVVRKIGVPSQPELAMGAVGPDGTRVVNEKVVRLLRIPDNVLEQLTARERDEAERRERKYRKGRGRELVRGRHVVVVDDGLATGASMRVAIRWLRAAGARRITVGVPTGPRETCDQLCAEVDEVVCLTSLERLGAISLCYEDFTPTSDEEVQHLLEQAARRQAVRRRGGAPPPFAH